VCVKEVPSRRGRALAITAAARARLALGVAILVVQVRVVCCGQSWDDVPYPTEIAPPRLAAAAAVQRGARALLAFGRFGRARPADAAS
jgi:hypothetical protein